MPTIQGERIMARNVLARHPVVRPEPKSIKHLLQTTVNEAGEQIGYKYRGKDGVVEVTYKEFQKHTFYLGTALVDMGLSTGHIACSGENSYNWITVFVTALQSEGVFCPIDKDLPDDDLVNIINHGDDDIIFCDKKREEAFKRIRDRIQRVQYFICFDRDEDEGEFLSYNKLIAKGKELYENGDKRFTDIENEDKQKLKMLIYTSGTTGLAKGVMLSEHNILSLVHWGIQLTTLRDVALSVFYCQANPQPSFYPRSLYLP